MKTPSFPIPGPIYAGPARPDPDPTDNDVPSSAHSLFAAAAWRAAQGDHAVELAILAECLGRLDARLRTGGWRQRLAVEEAAGLSWWVGDRVGVDRLSLWLGARLSGAQDDAQALARAGWAARRLGAATDPRADPDAFFGRAGAAGALAGDLDEAAADTAGLHPLVAAARLFHLWRLRGLSRPVDEIEAAVLAMRLARPPGGASGPGAFLPLARPSPVALTQSGAVADRLAAWLQGGLQATRAALADMDRLTAWEAMARDRVGARFDDGLRVACHWPVLSVQLFADQTGVSRATAARHLARLVDAGVLREITGQSRYRAWTAAT